MSKIIVSCDEKDCCEVHEIDLEKVQLINWRCDKHKTKVELKSQDGLDAYNSDENKPIHDGFDEKGEQYASEQFKDDD
jgi:hypothetical protein